MILSFTPNPALDLTLAVPDLVIGRVNRTEESHLDPGGKGINVSRVVHRLGGETVAVCVLGGHVGKLAERALREEGVPTEIVWIRAETRLNVILQDRSTSEGTRVYDRGPAAGGSCVRRIDETLDRLLPGASVFVSSGSLLPGLPDDLHERLLRQARDVGTKTIVDAGGEVLLRALTAGPDLVKPNAREAGEILGRTLDTEEKVVDAAHELRRLGAGTAVVSRGEHGAIMASPEGTFRAVPPPVTLRSAVGSGDSMVAALALALAHGQPLEEGLRIASAAGAATAASLGTGLAEAEEIRELVDDVVVEAL